MIRKVYNVLLFLHWKSVKVALDPKFAIKMNLLNNNTHRCKTSLKQIKIGLIKVALDYDKLFKILLICIRNFMCVCVFSK